MAAFDKLMKALESVRITQQSSLMSPKEKMQQCALLTDEVCSYAASSSNKSSESSSRYLGAALEVFLQLIDDPESADVRAVAEEHLNRLTRTLADLQQVSHLM